MKNIFKRILALAAVVITAAGAAVHATDYVLGETASIVGKEIPGTVTLPAEADLYLDTNFAQYNFIKIDGKEASTHDFGGDYGHVLCWKGMAAGSHTVTNGWPDNDPCNLRFYVVENLEMRSVQPEQGSVVSPTVNQTGEIIFTANRPFTFTNAYLLLPSGKQSGSLTHSGAVAALSQTVKLRQELINWYADGTLKAEGGDLFLVCLEGIEADGIKLGANGKYDVSFLTAPRAMQLQATNIHSGSDLLSFYPEGDQRAIFTMTFDGPVCTDKNYSPVATLGIGNIEDPSGYYHEVIRPVVEGNTITFDLSGVNRRPAIKLCGDFDGQAIAFNISNVFDLDHRPAQSLSEGNVGSFPYYFVYREVPETPVDFSFKPETGSSLEKAEKLTIWLNNTQVFASFSGLKFEYADGTSDLIPADRLTNELSGTEARYVVDIPARAKTEPVTVSLDGIVSLDGYNKHIYAVYNTLAALFSAPFEAYKSYEGVAENTPLTVEVNYAMDRDGLEATYAIVDVLNGMERTLLAGDMTRNRFDEFQATIPQALTFYLGHNYELRLLCTDPSDGFKGTIVIPFEGATRPAGYSPIEFVSLTPDSGQLTPDALVLTAEYSDDVAINPETSGWFGADGALQPFASLTPLQRNGSSADHAYMWELRLPEAALEAGPVVTLHIGATDNDASEPRPVQGDLRTEDATDVKVFTFSAATSLEAIEATVPTTMGIFTLSGRRAAAASIDALPAGVYIINGKKTLKM